MNEKVALCGDQFRSCPNGFMKFVVESPAALFDYVQKHIETVCYARVSNRDTSGSRSDFQSLPIHLLNALFEVRPMNYDSPYFPAQKGGHFVRGRTGHMLCNTSCYHG